MTTWNQQQYEKQRAEEVKTFSILAAPGPGERGQPWPVAEAKGRTADEALDAHARGMGFANAADARTRQHPGTGFHLLRAELSDLADLAHHVGKQSAGMAELSAVLAELSPAPEAPRYDPAAEAARIARRRAELLLAAVEAGDEHKMRDMLGQGADPNARNEAGETALMVATRLGDAYLARVLVLAGADPNAKPAPVARRLGQYSTEDTARLFAELAERATLDGPLDDVIAEEGPEIARHHAKLTAGDLAQSPDVPAELRDFAAAYFAASEVMQARVFEPWAREHDPRARAEDFPTVAEWAPGPAATVAEPDPAAEWKAEADRLREALALEKAGHAHTRAQRDAARQLLTQAQPLIQAAAGRLGVQEPAQDPARRAKVAL